MAEEQTEILLVLHNIEDRLQEILQILGMVHGETIEAARRRILGGSPLRKRILELCNGDRSVSEIAKELQKSIQQVSNNITVMQNAGLIEEIRSGKEKHYVRTT